MSVGGTGRFIFSISAIVAFSSITTFHSITPFRPVATISISVAAVATVTAVVTLAAIAAVATVAPFAITVTSIASSTVFTGRAVGVQRAGVVGNEGSGTSSKSSRCGVLLQQRLMRLQKLLVLSLKLGRRSRQFGEHRRVHVCRRHGRRKIKRGLEGRSRRRCSRSLSGSSLLGVEARS